MQATVRAALVQAEWTGDQESMISKNEGYAREAAEQGAQVLCFQEIFSAPYFCTTQDRGCFSYAEEMPGPTTDRMQRLARETGMVLIVPMFEKVDEGTYYNSAAVINADGDYLGIYR
ncbi:MAG: acyltransferase, partial [Acidimicrobiia bacterium]|nr:acyltransferase [Acidimicrobiia bacterium]